MSPCSALVTICHPLPGRLAETGLPSRPPPPLAVGSTCSRGVPRGIFGRTVPKHPGPQSESSQEESPGSGREVTVFAQCSRQPGARFHLCCSVPPRFPSHLTHRDPHSQVKLISMLRTAPSGSRAVPDGALWEPSVTCRPPTHVPCRVRPDLRSRHAGLGARGLHARWSTGAWSAGAWSAGAWSGCVSDELFARPRSCASESTDCLLQEIFFPALPWSMKITYETCSDPRATESRYS